MPDLRAAILNAAQAADVLHMRYGTKERATDGEGRIDVFGMLDKEDIPMMFRKLDKLLGAFLNEGGNKGVLVTTQRRLPVQRFTAAHELGHAVLGHNPSADSEEILARSPVVDREDGPYDAQEIQANVFASALLVPQWLLVSHMRRQNWTAHNLADADIVYQLSLRLGCSYAATCHALGRHGVLKPQECDRLLKVERREIKARLVSPYQPTNWHRDVWVVTERDDGCLLEGSWSDLVVVKLHEHSGAGYLWRLDELQAAGLAVVQDSRDTGADGESIGGAVFRTVIAESRDITSRRVSLREVRPWQANGSPLHSLTLEVDLTGPVRAGLHQAQRQRALQGAA